MTWKLVKYATKNLLLPRLIMRKVVKTIANARYLYKDVHHNAFGGRRDEVRQVLEYALDYVPLNGSLRGSIFWNGKEIYCFDTDVKDALSLARTIEPLPFKITSGTTANGFVRILVQGAVMTPVLELEVNYEYMAFEEEKTYYRCIDAI